eukprot:282622-Amphidinium_carterae.1
MAQGWMLHYGTSSEVVFSSSGCCGTPGDGCKESLAECVASSLDYSGELVEAKRRIVAELVLPCWAVGCSLSVEFS